MADSPRRRYSGSPSPFEEKDRSKSRSRSRSRSIPVPRSNVMSRSRSRSRSRGRTEVVNPGNTLYITGLSTRVTERDLEDHFSKEGKVKSVFLVVEPRSRVSRGFAFITMDNMEDADRCIKHLNQSILEGRYITVERSRRKRARTPTPGHYLGLKNSRGDGPRGGGGGDRGRPRGYSGREDYGYRRSPRRSPYHGGRDYSPPPRRSPYRGGRDYSPPPPRRSPPRYGGGGGRSRRERSYSPPYRSPERNYVRGSSGTAAAASSPTMYGAPSLLNPNTLNTSSSSSSSFLIPSTSSTCPLYATRNSFLYRNFTISKPFPKRAVTISSPPYSLQSSAQHGIIEEDDEPIIGDCVVFEEGIFNDPFLQEEKFRPTENSSRNNKRSTEVRTENLIPEKWIDVQREINITKKERRMLAQKLEHGTRLEMRRMELKPLEDGQAARKVDAKEFLKYRNEKLKQLKPLVLDNPKFTKNEVDEKALEIKPRGIPEVSSDLSESSTRVTPRNPRLAVYGRGFDDITEFFNSGNYDPDAAKKSEGRLRLFTNEEKFLLNRRIPDLAPATSDKWIPLHTLAASGDFYHMTLLLKHVADINRPNKDGLTAIHKAILGKKQAIFNCLLRESANPFVCDKDGASLMHYAVRTASTQMIKILLLYNVDINISDNDGWTPLHLGVQSGRPDIVRLLLIKGADKTLVNKDGLTALDMCLYSGRDTKTCELIKLLKQHPKTRLRHIHGVS